ncbi:MAG: hypothetical protein IIB65_03800 [Proteobacteria bacterium]|nr:hypothetical protein [Pseudomonadota bacterium]MCH8097527.1 hypothetical protein [Pseudomonadota bacterium]
MAESDNARSGWTVGINGTTNEPNGDQIVVVRHDRPHIRLEISAPGIRSAGEDQLRQGRQAIQDAVTALQEALDSPSALAGFHP